MCAKYIEQVTITLSDKLPEKKKFIEGFRRAPSRNFALNKKETILALKNALRYIPEHLHEELAPEFLEELMSMGRIYGYRYRPAGRLKGKPVDEYEGILQARALQVMIDNNLDFDIALYPYELVTYGETGQVFQNWMQYQLIMKYLQIMTIDQTLVVSSGHPVGLFPSKPEAPRVISTNGLMVGNWDNQEEFKRLTALGVTNYGQMTAGGWMYIGPQGIVHGTYIKATEIAGGIGVIAEVDLSRIETRYSQGWVARYSDNLEEIAEWVKEYRNLKKPVSIAYHGNIVDLLEYWDKNKLSIDLFSDQTSCHAVYDGGYTPAGISFEEGRELIKNNPDKFRQLVDKALIRHYTVIKKLTDKGGFFWDYGNSFMASVFDAGMKEIAKNGVDTNEGFIWPSYVEDIMGPICFDRGYGPFRWVI